jgi:hypothetical protein
MDVLRELGVDHPREMRKPAVPSGGLVHRVFPPPADRPRLRVLRQVRVVINRAGDHANLVIPPVLALLSQLLIQDPNPMRGVIVIRQSPP